jgi:PKD repeat protein
VSRARIKHPVLVLVVAVASLIAAGPASSATTNTAPTANFTFAPSAPVTGENVTFTSTSTDSDGQIIYTAWDLDNDGDFDDGTATTATKKWTTPGTYTVRVAAVDDDYSYRIATKTVTVKANGAPVAGFSYTPASPQTGEAINLTSTSTDPDGRALTEEWDLDNDGAYDDKTGHTASTSFASNGNHRVSVRVTDSGGAVQTSSRDINVQNRSPQAAFSMSASTVDTGTAVTFTSTSSDPDGTVASYKWDFNNDGVTDATTATASKSFATSGTYTVKLTVTDNDGASSSTTQQVTVRNRGPVAAFGMSASTVDSGTAVNFTSSSTDPDGSIVSYKWDFDNDGVVDSTTANPSKTFAKSGSYDVKLTVTDNDGASSSVSHTVTVRNRGPQAAFTASATTTDSGAPVTFTSTSTDPDGSIASWKWDFDNDGTVDATTAVASHAFATAGTATVKLTVTDDGGASSSTTQAVTVKNRAPVAAFTFGPSAPFTGDDITLTSAASDPDGTLAEQAWDLDGDGAYDDATGAVVHTSFATVGAHMVALRVKDNNGAMSAPAFQSIDVASKPVTPVDPPKPPAGGGSGSTQGAATVPTPAKTVVAKLMSPFPRIRIHGVTTAKGAKLGLLGVRTGGGNRIYVRCKGRGCPWDFWWRDVASSANTMRLVKVPGFAKPLRAGAVIEIFVTRKDAIGKYMRLKIRRGLKPPSRTDSCTAPGARKVRRCPAK